MEGSNASPRIRASSFARIVFMGAHVPGPIAYTRRIAAGYCATTASTVNKVVPSTIDCAISSRSKRIAMNRRKRAHRQRMKTIYDQLLIAVVD